MEKADNGIELREENSRHVLKKMPISLMLWGYVIVAIVLIVVVSVYILLGRRMNISII